MNPADGAAITPRIEFRNVSKTFAGKGLAVPALRDDMPTPTSTAGRTPT